MLSIISSYICGTLLRKIIAHLEPAIRLKKYLWRAMITCAFFAAFRVSEYLVSDDDAKRLTMDRVFWRTDG